MRASARSEGGRQPERPDTAAAIARRGSADFETSLAALREAVRAACAPHAQWEARVVAGIQAALGFAATESAMAHALIVHGRRRRGTGGDREQEVIDLFARMLHGVIPAKSRPPIATDRGVVEAIATVTRGHLQAGSVERLPAAAPDLVYLALLPHLGTAGARRWADSVEARSA